jgi:hypothetical protein
MFCYYLTSMSTTIREFRVLRMSEFFDMSYLILNPKLGLTDHLNSQNSKDLHEKFKEMLKFV